MRLCANMCGLVCQLIWKFKSQQISSNTSTIVFTNLESTTCSILQKTDFLRKKMLTKIKDSTALCVHDWIEHYVYMTGLSV